jgi:hypothetical protein
VSDFRVTIIPGEVNSGQQAIMSESESENDNSDLHAELAQLQQEHRDLDIAIHALETSARPDLLQVQRLKKRKLQLRDRISYLEDQITPDIIA